MNSFSQKWKRAEDKGFYIILFLCIAAIGIASYVLFFSDAAQTPDYSEYTVEPSDSTLEQWQPSAQPEEQAATAITEQPKQADQPVEEQPSTSVMNPKPAQTPEEETEPGAGYYRPVPGEVVKGFSATDLQYDQTMADWRVHLGTDFAANPGDRVYAVGAGTVQSVEDTLLEGRCIQLQLEDGGVVRYTGLSESTTVEQGDTVQAGDVLGAVGEAFETEIAQGPHLHIEYVQGGEPADIETLIPAA